MSVNSAMTNLANKIRKLLGTTNTMNLTGMASGLDTVQECVDSAYTAVESKGGTVPESKEVGMLQHAINSIPAGATVQVKTGTVTGVSGSAKTVNLGWKPDAVFFTGTIPQLGNAACHAGVAFHEKNVTSMETFFSGSSNSYLFSQLSVKQTSTGFSVSAKRFTSAGSLGNESNRSLSYIAIKYTE